MQETFTFIDSVMGFDSFNSEKLKSSKIFSFNIHAHKFLVEKNIEHDIAENYLEKGKILWISNPKRKDNYKEAIRLMR